MKMAFSLYCLLWVALPLQAATLTGIVRDAETGMALPDVNIRVQGQATGAVTDQAGRYTLSLAPGVYVLRVSRIGFAPAEIRIAAADITTRDFSLKPILLPGQAVTVTASRGIERQTPITFSNLTRKELEDRYTIQDLPKMLSELPSVNTWDETGNGIGYSYITMRGFDQRRIAVMINGIPQNDPEDHNVYWVNFADLASSLEDIQVQRGAGSAFYGPPAIGGSINLITDRFNPEPALTLTSGIGSFRTRRWSATLNSGLLDNRMALHAHFSKTLSDGYREKAWVDFQSYFFGGAYYTDRTSTRFHIYGSKNRDHLNFYGISPVETVNGRQVDALKDRDLRRRNPITGDDEIEDFHQPHYEILHEWTLSPERTLHNSVFYVQGAGFFDFDGSWADTTYFRLTSENGFTPTGNPGQSLIRAYVNNRQGGWLPRLTHHTDRFTTDMGLEIRYHQSIHWGQIRWAQSLPPELTPDFRYYDYKGEKWMASAYANHAHKLSDRIHAQFGVQLAYNRYRLFDEAFLGTEFSVPHLFINPKAGLNFNLTDRVNLYSSLARTSREPRLKNYYDPAESTWMEPQFDRRDDGSLDFGSPSAQPEKLTNLEVGLGYTAPILRASANYFWMDFRDEIVKDGSLDRFGQPRTGNAEKTLHTGIELSAALRPIQAFTLQGNLSYSRNSFKRHTVYQKGQPVSYDGNRIAGFPDLLANVRATIEQGPWRASLRMRYVGKKYTDNTQDNRQNPALRDAPGYIPLYVQSYAVADLGLAYDIGPYLGARKMELRLEINNLFDTLYVTHGQRRSFFPAATRNAFFLTRFQL